MYISPSLSMNINYFQQNIILRVLPKGLYTSIFYSFSSCSTNLSVKLKPHYVTVMYVIWIHNQNYDFVRLSPTSQWYNVLLCSAIVCDS